jgi:hypothetical protein
VIRHSNAPLIADDNAPRVAHKRFLILERRPTSTGSRSFTASSAETNSAITDLRIQTSCSTAADHTFWEVVTTFLEDRFGPTSLCRMTANDTH